MRTTITLAPDVEALVKRAMRERGLSFKEVVNEAIRKGLGQRAQQSDPAMPVFDMGEPLIDLTKALQLAGELEDQDQVEKLKRGA